MDYKCFLCADEFSDEKKSINHLKTHHLVQNGTMNMNCLINHRNPEVCSNKYKTFASLQKHMKYCVKVKNSKIPINRNRRVFFIFCELHFQRKSN